MNIKIGINKEIASCNSCGAKNFDCLITGKKKDVDAMSYIKIGNMHINICEKCLNKLSILSNKHLIETA